MTKKELQDQRIAISKRVEDELMRSGISTKLIWRDGFVSRRVMEIVERVRKEFYDEEIKATLERLGAIGANN